MRETHQLHDRDGFRTCAMILLFTALLVACGTANARGLAGLRELSMSGQVGKVKMTEEYSYHSPYSSSSHTYESTSTFMTLAFRYGWYVYRGLEIEPEIHWTSWENIKPVVSLHANVAYNFSTSKPPDKPRAITFILVGYGIGNAVPFYYTCISAASDKWDVGVFNFGGGIKAFVAENVALRMEYRFQRYAWDEEYTYSSSKITQSFHNVFFGFSFFLPPRYSE